MKLQTIYVFLLCVSISHIYSFMILPWIWFECKSNYYYFINVNEKRTFRSVCVCNVENVNVTQKHTLTRSINFSWLPYGFQENDLMMIFVLCLVFFFSYFSLFYTAWVFMIDLGHKYGKFYLHVCLWIKMFV